MKLQKIGITAETVANLGDTVAENLDDRVASPGDEFDAEGETEIRDPADVSTPVNGNEFVGAAQYLQGARANHRAGKNPNNPLDIEQRIDLALGDAERATTVATDTARVVNNLSHHVTSGFAKIGQQLDQLASGKPAPELPGPGASVFDEE